MLGAELPISNLLFAKIKAPVAAAGWEPLVGLVPVVPARSGHNPDARDSSQVWALENSDSFWATTKHASLYCGDEDGCLFAQNQTLLPPGSVLQRIWGDPWPGIPRTLCLCISHKAAGTPVTGAAEHSCDANPCSRAKGSRSGWKSAHTPLEQEILLPNSVSMRANVFRSLKGDSKRSFKQLTR